MSSTRSQYGTYFNTAPPEADLSEGFLAFLLPLHRELTPRQQSFIRQRAAVLESAHKGQKPNYLPPSEATTTDWTIPLPEWCADQRNQMTGPADDAELVVKMLNSGAPGVMLDLEDSMANTWSNLTTGLANIDAALNRELTYFDAKRNRNAGINDSKTVTFIRPRGLHISQAGVLNDELMSASLFDVAMVAYKVDADCLKHPLSFYIPKSESAEEALWWRDLFRAIEDARGWPRGYILWELLHSEPYVPALGAMTGCQAVQQVQAGLKAIYLSGWQVAADANLAGQMYPDQSLYPANSVPDVVRKINQALQRADQIDHAEGRNGIDWFVPIVADAEAGFGGNLNAFELTKAMIEAGAAAVHFEDQLAAAKKCGHMGGKVLVPTQEFIQKLIAARLAADVMGVDTILVARTDADAAGLITSDIDERDHQFLTGRRPPSPARPSRNSFIRRRRRKRRFTKPNLRNLWMVCPQPSC